MGNVSAVRGALVAGSGHTSISSSDSLRGPESHTSTVGESDTGDNCLAVRSVPCDMRSDLRQLQNDLGRWKARQEMVNAAERPNTPDDTI